MVKRLTLFALFLVSYIPLFVILAIQHINDKFCSETGEPLSLLQIVYNNRLSLTLISISLIALLYYFVFSSINYRSGFKNPVRIKKVENTGVEYLSYLATYILPFIGLKFSTWNEVLATILLFLIIGFIYTRTNLIYANPTLALFGYYLYKVTLDNDEQKTVISEGKVRKEQFYRYKEFNEDIYFIKIS
jgi:hypothetical protein